MCLAIPGKIIAIENENDKVKFIIDYGAEKREALGSAVKVKKGDYVIVSSKIIINRITKAEAKKFLEMVK